MFTFRGAYQVMKNNKGTNLCIAILSGLSGVMLITYILIGVPWFDRGDFNFRTAIAYHGILIPAWLMLGFAYFQYSKHSNLAEKLSVTGAISAGILTGLGGILIEEPGFSL